MVRSATEAAQGWMGGVEAAQIIGGARNAIA
jgi:hypothetical protein